MTADISRVEFDDCRHFSCWIWWLQTFLVLNLIVTSSRM